MSVSVSSDFDIQRALKEAKRIAFAEVLEQARTKTQFLRCPEHGEPAILTLDDDNGGNSASIQVSACCEKFTHHVARIVTE